MYQKKRLETKEKKGRYIYIYMDSAEKTTTTSSKSFSSWWERAKRRPIDGKALVTIVLLSVLWVMCSSHVFSSSSVGGDVKALNDDDVNDDGLLPIAKEELEEVLREEENG